MSSMTRAAALAAIAAATLTALPAHAQTPEEFWRGRNIDYIVPTSPGGDYDLRSRLMARHFPRLLPGNPNIVVRNMPGGLGIAAANYLAKAAPRDGSVMHTIFQNMPTLQAIGSKEIQFDVREFGWIGNTTNTPNVINSLAHHGHHEDRGRVHARNWSSARRARRRRPRSIRRR